MFSSLSRFKDRVASQRTQQDYLKDAIDKAWAHIEFEPDGKILGANTIFLQTMGYTNEEIIGKHHRMFCDKQHVQSKEYQDFWKNLAAGQSLSDEFPRVAKDGAVIWLNASYTPVVNIEGQVVKVIKIASNITEMVRTRNQATWVKNAVDTGWSMIEFTTEGVILGANDNFLNTFGYEEHEILGKHHRMFCDVDYARSEEYSSFWKNLAAGQVSTDSFKRLTKAGDEKYIYASYTPVKGRTGEVVKVIKIASDITEAVKSRQKLSQLMEQVKLLSGTVTHSSKDLSGRSVAMNSSVAEMSSAIEQIAEGSQDQRLQLEEISQFLINLRETSTDTADRTREIKEAAESGVSEAKNGKIKLQSLVESMHGISGNSDIVTESIAQMIQKSHEIAGTLSVITEIASETNMLSLNAGIQAARAGAAGKSFAVVAEEIRKLAENSRLRVDEIRKVITDTQSEVKKADEAIRTMSVSVKAGEEISHQAEEAFERLEKSTTNTLEKSQAIEESAEFQNTSINKIVEAVERIVVVSEETATGSEQLATSSSDVKVSMEVVEQTSRDLLEQAEELEKLIEQE
ncbi:methyl-accepting chemotaxis protein [Marinoscillum sp.]|uniref:methyl-accepting chemotaxis protein n=1 Tax=Marinoscillum sp. TaxID=2024838 RepID=UPI003BA9DA66